MTNTLRSVVLLVCLGAMPGIGHAEARPAHGEFAVYRTRLALTAEQLAQFRNILQDKKAQMASLRNDASLSTKERSRQAKSIRMDCDAKLRATLNESQQTEFDQIRREQRERAMSRRQTMLPPQ